MRLWRPQRRTHTGSVLKSISILRVSYGNRIDGIRPNASGPGCVRSPELGKLLRQRLVIPHPASSHPALLLWNLTLILSIEGIGFSHAFVEVITPHSTGRRCLNAHTLTYITQFFWQCCGNGGAHRRRFFVPIFETLSADFVEISGQGHSRAAYQIRSKELMFQNIQTCFPATILVLSMWNSDW